MPRGGKVSGERIRELREARRLLQHDLATKLRSRGYGTTQATISRWEAGQEPRASVLPALASELGVTVDELYGDDEEEDSSLPSAHEMVAVLMPRAALTGREQTLSFLVRAT